MFGLGRQDRQARVPPHLGDRFDGLGAVKFFLEVIRKRRIERTALLQIEGDADVHVGMIVGPGIGVKTRTNCLFVQVRPKFLAFPRIRTVARAM